MHKLSIAIGKEPRYVTATPINKEAGFCGIISANHIGYFFEGAFSKFHRSIYLFRYLKIWCGRLDSNRHAEAPCALGFRRLGVRCLNYPLIAAFSALRAARGLAQSERQTTANHPSLLGRASARQGLF